MELSPPPDAPVDVRLTTVLGMLRSAMAGWGLQALFAVLLYRRIGVIIRRITRLLHRFNNGTLRPGTTRRAAAATGATGATVGTRRPAQRMPCRSGWLLRAGKHHAAFYTAQLQTMLAEPEMAALLAASPAAVRLLKPLCRALAVDVPIMRPAPRPARPPKPRTPRPRRPMPDLGRIPLPRGVLTAARRQGFGKW